MTDDFVIQACHHVDCSLCESVAGQPCAGLPDYAVHQPRVVAWRRQEFVEGFDATLAAMERYVRAMLGE